MSHFKTHILSKHLEVEGKFACEYCDFKTWDKCYLNKHVKNHEIQGHSDGGMNLPKETVVSQIIKQKDQLPTGIHTTFSPIIFPA